MKILSRLFFLISFFLTMFLTTPAFALEKARFLSFIKEYDASQIKFNSKIAYAIETGYPDVAEFLILRGEEYLQYSEAYPLPEDHFATNKKDLRNFHIKHPLITSIRKGYTDIAVLMIQKGDLKAEEYRIEYDNVLVPQGSHETSRKNAMIVAIEQNNYDVVIMLLNSGFDVNTSAALNLSPERKKYPYMQDRSVYATPLLQAIVEKKLDIAEMLLKHGADVDKFSNSSLKFDVDGNQRQFYGSPLLQAVDGNFIEGVDLLLKYKANPLGSYYITPFQRAIDKQYIEIVDLLFDSINIEKNK